MIIGNIYFFITKLVTTEFVTTNFASICILRYKKVVKIEFVTSKYFRTKSSLSLSFTILLTRISFIGLTQRERGEKETFYKRKFFFSFSELEVNPI